MSPSNQAIFTDAEIEKMRLLVTEHDKRGSVNQFDLNNPPRTNYTHQPFPKLVYNLDADDKPLHKKVHDAEEHEAALAAGWTNEPVAAAEAEEPELDPASATEAAAVDQRIAEARNKKAKRAAK